MLKPPDVPSAGLHLIQVSFDDVPVPKSPFRVSVSEGCDPSRVQAYGPGLEEGLVNKPNCFTVKTRFNRLGSHSDGAE